MTRSVTVEVPEDAVKLLGDDPERFGREMYEAAIVQWYEEGRVTSGSGAKLLGISRSEFLEILHRHKVSPFQYTPDELAADMNRG